MSATCIVIHGFHLSSGSPAAAGGFSFRMGSVSYPVPQLGGGERATACGAILTGAKSRFRPKRSIATFLSEELVEFWRGSDAFQAYDEGSIPFTRSNLFKHLAVTSRKFETPLSQSGPLGGAWFRLRTSAVSEGRVLATPNLSAAIADPVRQGGRPVTGWSPGRTSKP